MKKLSTLSLVLVMAINLEVPAQIQTCAADFTFRGGQTPETIIFSNTSSNAVSWYWSFGDGTTSTLQNPTHVYKLPGTYTVSLAVNNSDLNCSNTMVKQLKVGNPPCNAEFFLLVDTAGMKVSFDNSSTGSNLSYYWSFGDGNVSREPNPVHTYRYPGTYDITLTVQNDLQTCIDRYTMSTRVGTIICNADFDVFVDSASNTVTFTARKQDAANLYRWDFGDGGYATTPKVQKTFRKPGYYSARLTVSNATAGCLNSSKTEILVGKPAPGGKAGFIYVSGTGNKVQFSDRSLGEKLSYYWDFNDGNSSKEANPVNQYLLAGYYNVCLTVSDAAGIRNTYCEKIFAGESTTDQCLAKFDYRLTDDQREIYCFDRSLGDPDSWKWIYDDGWTTTSPNPHWTHNPPWIVKIQLTVRNSVNGCRDDVFGLVNMGAEEKLVAGFGYIIDESGKKADTYPIDFVGVSLGDAGKLKWDFGDGTYDSTSINPHHVYSQPGQYEVCLTVTNTTTGEEDTSCETVTVGPVSTFDQPGAHSPGIVSYPNPFSDHARIEILLTRDSEFDLALYDFMGRKIQTIAHDSETSGVHSFELDGSDYEAGNYYVVLRTSEGVSRTMISLVK